MLSEKSMRIKLSITLLKKFMTSAHRLIYKATTSPTKNESTHTKSYKKTNIIKNYLLITIILFPLSINAEDIKHNGTTFYIPDMFYEEDQLVKNKTLINLILNTESMDNDERQYWFDIMPSMNQEQINKLLKILEVERSKLEELEIKYQKEIKSLNEKHLKEWKILQEKKLKEKIKTLHKEENETIQYLSWDDQRLLKVKILPITENNINDIFLPDEINEKEKLTKIDKMIIIEYGKEIILDIKRYEEVFGGEVISAYLNIISAYAIEVGDVEILNSMINKEISDKDQVLKKVFLQRKNYLGLAELHEKSLKSEDWNSNLLTKLLDLTYYKYTEECKKYCSQILVRYFKKMSQESYPFKYKNIKNHFYSELIFWDMILYFNSDIIPKELKKSMLNFISLYKKNKPAYYTRDKQPNWYFNITNYFFEEKLNKLYDDRLTSFKNGQNSFETEGELLEVGTYLSYSLIKNNLNEDALPILLTVKGLGKSLYSDAYNYMEHDAIDFLINVISSPTSFKKGPTNLGIYQANGSSKKFEPFGEKYAIIVGISDYQDLESYDSSNDGLVDLKYAHNDAESFLEFIKNPALSGGNWNIQHFTNKNAKALDIRKAIDKTLTNAKENDLVYIFFSGHARLNPNNNEEVYLLTHDFKKNDPYSGIPYNWLISSIERSKVRHLVTFVDACRSGTVSGTKGESSVDQDLLREINNHSSTKVIFTSGSGSQISYEDDSLAMGVFTHYLIEGLNGESKDLNNDGYVNLNELEDYTSKKVSTYSESSNKMTYQRPRISNLNPTFSIQFPISIR